MSSVSNISKVSKTSSKSANSSTSSKHLTKKHTSFTQLYYPPHETPIKNDVVINKNHNYGT